MSSQSSKPEGAKKRGIAKVPSILNPKIIGNFDEAVIQQFKNIFLENMNNMLCQWHLKKSYIADVCNVSRPSVTQWFTGRNFPTSGNLMLIAQLIDRNPQSFFKRGGICLDKYDGGFQWDTYYKSDTDNDVFADATKALYADFYDNVIKDEDFAVESEFLNTECTDDIKSLNIEEKRLIGSWRLLSPRSKLHILHSISLEIYFGRTQSKKHKARRIKIAKKEEALKDQPEPSEENKALNISERPSDKQS